ncbi:hypothetical protein Fcan01_20131 [Folsomia candida]|uniref:Odorant receptor n=1 Tax=Folsomia candida TaxID=158441 RepID=A0A226DKM3_FOLCA|nr:hypothetical protein Fcan01_20131 [Folsomia candida]
MSKIVICHRVVRHLRIGNYFHCIFATFDTMEGKISLISKKNKRLVLSFTVLQFLVIIVRIWSIATTRADLLESIFGIAIASLTVIGFVVRCDPFPDDVQVQFLNYIFSSKDEVSDRGATRYLNLLALFFDVVEFTYYSISTVLGLLALFLPCQPGLTSSIICSSEGVLLSGLIFKFLYLFFFPALEFLIYMQVAVGTAYNFVTVLLTGVTFLWLECAFFIKCYQKELADLADYRKIQIFEKILNSCTREGIFLKFVILIPSLQVLMSLVAIKMFHSGHDLLAVMFCWMYVIILGSTLLTFSAAAKVYGTSTKWIQGCKGGERKKYARKMHRSLIPLRLHFGNNFVEILTPLVVQEYCVRQTVTFLLLTK